MKGEAQAWLKGILEADRAPVLAKSDLPDRRIIRELERAGCLVRLPGEVMVIKRPGDRDADVVRKAYWPIVAAIQKNYEPSVVERDSAVRILVGDASPPPILRVRNGRNSSNFEIPLVEDLKIVVAAGLVNEDSVNAERIADATVFLDDPARILISLELRFLRENLPMVGLWLKSLVIPREAIESAYQEHPRPVVLRRLAHLAEDAGNPRLAEILAEVVRANQHVRIGRGQTGVGRNLVLPPEIRHTPTTRRPWLDRLNIQLTSFQQQITEEVESSGLANPSFPIPDLVTHARNAKTLDVYHSTSIEGYRIRYEDVSMLLGGSPEGRMGEEEIRNRLAVLGYSHAFDDLLLKVEQRGGNLPITNLLVFDLFANLFQPSVEAGLVEPGALRGWRNAPVFIRGSRYVPPAADRVPELMSALIEHLPTVPSALVSGILAHLIFVTIHPFPDGNGRVGRFLMNAILISNGWPWLTIKEGERGTYFESLREAQLQDNAQPFARFIVERESDLVRAIREADPSRAR